MRSDIALPLAMENARRFDLSWTDINNLREAYPQLEHVWNTLEDMPEKHEREMREVESNASDDIEAMERRLCRVFDLLEQIRGKLLNFRGGTDAKVNEIFDLVRDAITEAEE